MWLLSPRFNQRALARATAHGRKVARPALRDRRCGRLQHKAAIIHIDLGVGIDCERLLERISEVLPEVLETTEFRTKLGLKRCPTHRRRLAERTQAIA